MPSIHQLPPSVVNKIAAGEVVERPASVVKELLENAVDAQPRRIDLSVAKGGLDWIRVADDGTGIDPDELELAVTSHATSKIQDADDLFHVGTLGFRGEALASIAEISHLTLRSRRQGNEHGAELRVRCGQRDPYEPAACPVGTVVEIRNLFASTPVRRRFLRTPQTEMGHVSEAFARIALAWPTIHFTLRHNDRLLHDLPPASDRQQRIAAFFGQELVEQLLPVDSMDEAIRLSGFVAKPVQNRATTRMQYFFLNGRHFRDRGLQHALGEAYRGLLMTGRQPIAFLWFDMPPEDVDVNVHPTKTEVRFQDSGRHYAQLLGTLRKLFLSADLNATARIPSQAANSSGLAEAASTENNQQALAAWAKGQLSLPASSDPAKHVAHYPGTSGEAAVPSWSGGSGNAHTDPLELREFTAPASAIHEPTVPATSPPAARPMSEPGDALGGRGALQMHNRYLVCENDSGIEIIDQHALHERILYEQLRLRIETEQLDVQRLLVPLSLDVTAEEYAAVERAGSRLREVGLEVEGFGGTSLLLRGYPAILDRADPAKLLRDVIDFLATRGRSPDASEIIDHILHLMACKAAVKAGDPLEDEEIAALLEQRHANRYTHHCPHGRPTSLVFTREALDRQFGRT